MFNPENKNVIENVKKQITTINNTLNKAIAENMASAYDIDREQLRTIRDQNIETMVLIQKMEMREQI